MKLSTPIKLLNKLGLFDSVRNIYYFLSDTRPQVYTFYSQFIKKGELYFDIGANLGRKADIFLRLGTQAVLVEPQPKCLRFLQNKYTNNPRVTLIGKGCDFEITRKKMFLCEANALSTLSADWQDNVNNNPLYDGLTWKGETEVETTTLDQLIAEFGKPQLCKIDVEGYEWNVIQGLTQTIPHIIFEVSPHTLDNTEKIVHYLSKLGKVEFNFGAPERYQYELKNFAPVAEMVRFLKDKRPEECYGDIYVKFN